MKTCPRCKLVNPPDAARCDCGYDFQSGKIKTSYAKTSAFNNQSFSLGTLYAYLCFLACLILGYFLFRLVLSAIQTGDGHTHISLFLAFSFSFVLYGATGVAILRRKKYSITLSYVGAAAVVIGILARGIVPLDILFALPTFAIVFYLRKRSDILT